MPIEWQTVKQSDLGLGFLRWPVCPKIKDYYGISLFIISDIYIEESPCVCVPYSILLEKVDGWSNAGGYLSVPGYPTLGEGLFFFSDSLFSHTNAYKIVSSLCLLADGISIPHGSNVGQVVLYSRQPTHDVSRHDVSNY